MSIKSINVPDIGDYKNVDIVEIHVKSGDSVKQEDPLITLETGKASIDIPSPVEGIIKDVMVKIGEKVSKGDIILKLSSNNRVGASIKKEDVAAKPLADDACKKVDYSLNNSNKILETKEKKLTSQDNYYASPLVRRMSRILKIDLSCLKGTGKNNRITKKDCDLYYNNIISKKDQQSNNGYNILPDPDIDFSKFGNINIKALSRISKISADNLSRNWVRIPHVTFYDDADITNLDNFRKYQNDNLMKVNKKITLLSFLIKIGAFLLKKYPIFNSSLSNNKDLILKDYFNIGFAVNSPNGLVVPVIANVDKKNIIDIADEITILANKAKNNKISIKEMTGGNFTISSIGNLGTKGFTPIINMPEVSILGVSKSFIKPVWNGKIFVPKNTLPLSLSVDHRVIDGVLAANFLTDYCKFILDIRELLL